MSVIEYGIEKGYIEKQDTEDKDTEIYVIYPRRIMLELTLRKIIAEFEALGFEVKFAPRSKLYIASNRTMLSKQKEEQISNTDKVYDLCEKCDEPYEELKSHFIGSAAFISTDTKIDFKEVTAILCNKIYNDAIKWFEDGGLEEIMGDTDGEN